MGKYLIFRTDRIGDLIFSKIIINSILNKDSKNTIDLVCSPYNSNYAKNYKNINKTYILDKYNLILMIKNIFRINSIKYDYLIILDSKRRSFFFSIFLNAKYKIALLKNWRPKLLLKFFFDRFIINSDVVPQYQNFSTLANMLDIKLNKKIDYYQNFIGKRKKLTKNSNYLLLHLDEKWFDGFYHKDYTSIGLNFRNFNSLINSLFKKFKIKIIITTGKLEIKNLNIIINNFFNKISSYEYASIKFKKKLILFHNINFEDLEFIVKNSSIVFCCEGAISHVSHAYKKKTYALIDDYITAKFWTDHMNNIKIMKRSSIKEICNKIENL